MLKTNKFKTLLVLLVTVLGLNSVITNVYADKNSDKKTIANMALTFSNYQIYPDLNSILWAQGNTMSPAFDDPYRNGMNGKDYLAAIINIKQHNQVNNFISTKLVSEKISNKSAIAIVRRVWFQPSYSNLPPLTSFFLDKIWFQKSGGKWKISNYYTLLTKTMLGNKVSAAPVNIKNYDAVGTRFPY